MAKSRGKRRSRKKEELIEVVDAADKPIAALPRDQVHAQHLYHRSVLVLVYNKQKKLYLQQRSYGQTAYPGYWDLSAAGHVQAGESRREAALRELAEELRISISRLHPVLELTASKETDYEFVSLFATGPCPQDPDPNPEEILRGLFVEQHELEYLATTFSSLLTPSLKYCWNVGCLFSSNS
jgi:isopentenyl-diphosphate delta-isomerase